MPLTFGVTWDYRCPFARNAHDHVIEGLLAGADWQVQFMPFSLGQVHVADDEPDIWDTPERDSGLLALQVGVVVRDHHPERFLALHRGLFDARHVHGLHLRDRDVLTELVELVGLEAGAVFERIDSGEALDTVRKEHEAAVAHHDVWGVPTFVVGEHASFVRLINDSGGDGTAARRTVERVIDLLDGWPELNEFKHTTLSR
jgi:protein-disulfide isomerase-like protein with CxxC motif